MTISAKTKEKLAQFSIDLSDYLAWKTQLHEIGFSEAEADTILLRPSPLCSVQNALAYYAELKLFFSNEDITTICSSAEFQGVRLLLNMARDGILKNSGFDNKQICNLFVLGGSEALLAACIHNEKLLCLGFDLHQIYNIAAHASGVLNIDAALSAREILNILKITPQMVVEEVGVNNGHERFNAYLSFRASQIFPEIEKQNQLLSLEIVSSASFQETLTTMGYSQHQIAMLQYNNLGPENLSEFITLREKLLLCHFNKNQIYMIATYGGLQYLQCALDEYPILINLGYRPENIVTLMENKRGINIVKTVIMHDGILKMLNLTPNEIASIAGHEGGIKNIDFLITYKDTINAMKLKGTDIVAYLGGSQKYNKKNRDQLEVIIKEYIKAETNKLNNTTPTLLSENDTTKEEWWEDVLLDKENFQLCQALQNPIESKLEQLIFTPYQGTLFPTAGTKRGRQDHNNPVCSIESKVDNEELDSRWPNFPDLISLPEFHPSLEEANTCKKQKPEADWTRFFQGCDEQRQDTSENEAVASDQPNYIEGYGL